MKTALLLLAALTLSACSTFSGNSAPSSQNQSDKPFSQRTFNANDPYHGG
jgi:hypothetical protein